MDHVLDSLEKNIYTYILSKDLKSYDDFKKDNSLSKLIAAYNSIVVDYYLEEYHFNYKLTLKKVYENYIDEYGCFI